MLTPEPKKLPYQLLPYPENSAPPQTQVSEPQKEFLDCQAPLVLFCGGVGSGKTHAGALWLRQQALAFPRTLGLVGANTYLQLHKSTLPRLLAVLREHGPDYRFNAAPPKCWGLTSAFAKHENVLTLRNGAQVLAYSLDNYDAMRGIQVAYIWLDETRDTAVEAFEVALERLRGFDGAAPAPKYEVRVTTTPNGFDWLWERFDNPATRLPGTHLVRSTSYQNPFVGPHYARNLEARIGKNLAKQQIYAEFLSLTAGRAYDFQRGRHVAAVKYDPDLPLVFTHDFNWSPLCSVIMQANEHQAWVLDEIVIHEGGQTRCAAREFVRRYKDWRPREVLLYGDRHGGDRGTKDYTDFAILMQELRPHFRRVRDMATGARSPEIVERVQAVNALLDPAQDQPPRLRIHPRCEYLIRDLEQVTFTPGTRQLEKKRDRQITHLSDALSYAIAKLHPITCEKITSYDEDRAARFRTDAD